MVVMRTLIKTTFAVLFCTVGLSAAVVEADKSVAVMPLGFSYQVVQSFRYDYAKVESSLKGYAKENSSSRYRDNYRDGRYSSDSSTSSNHNTDGKYDLKGKAEAESYSYNDVNIVEKKLDTETYTGIIESALSEAGVKIAHRESISNGAYEVKTANVKKKEGKDVDALLKKAIKDKLADYVLTGQVNSIRLDGLRKVPDGTERRYSIKGTVKISVKITKASNGVSSFARTFTGVGTKTFDAGDSIPSAEVMDAAIDDVAAQLTAAVTGKKIANPSESDDEYQDSPGKRLRD